MTRLWIDASAGIAGDMLLGALLDAGAGIEAVRRAVEAVVPAAVEITTHDVTRAGFRALKADVTTRVTDPPHRTWRTVRAAIDDADLPAAVRDDAQRVFARLAAAEAAVHGIAAEEVHFHEVGALDAIADVVGVCAALHDLGATTISGGEVAVGSGQVRSEHGELPVPVPAVAALASGWRARAGGTGELATPTGMALLRTLAERCEDLPSMTVTAVGIGAGGRDTPQRANVVRVIVGSATSGTESGTGLAVLLEANVDDLDPRLWPGVLAALMDAGAADAWLTPILMKKGRPAHTVGVLCAPADAPGLRALLFEHTTTLGVRESLRHKTALERTFVPIRVAGVPIAIKIGHRDGVIRQVMPEFDDVAAAAHAGALPPRVVLAEALTAAACAGLITGSPWPPTTR